MSILVLNEGYSDNLGDQAINDSLIFLLKENKIDEIIFHDFTKDINKTIDIKTITVKKNSKDLLFYVKKLIPSKVKWLIKNVKRVIIVSNNEYDLVIIGGGQLILSNATFAIAMFTWIFFLRLFGTKNIVLFAVGSGTRFSFCDKLLFGYVLHNVSKVYVRDHKSQKVLKDIFAVKTEFVYDVAFMHNKLSHIKLIEKEQVLLGVISFNVYNKYNQKQLSKVQFFESWINFLNENHISIKKVKLFYTTQEDRQASLEFKEYVLKKYSVALELLETNTKEILVHELEQAKIVISARMHALILGLTYNCHIIPYKVSDKLREFDSMFGSADFNLIDIQQNIKEKMLESLHV